MGMKNELNVALSANERYMPGALVAAIGVAVYAEPETFLVFHLFTEGVKDETYGFWEYTLKRLHPHSQIIRHECDENVLAGLPYWAGSRMAAVRCHYATLMPDVDWCLYLDCDILYLSSVDEQFSYCDNSVYACVVQEEHERTRRDECAWIEKNCKVHILDESYFNSGVVLFNLKKMREDGIPAKLIQFFQDHPDVPSPDQDALNTAFAGHVKLLPAKFNRLQIYMTDDKLAERPAIHYVTGNPWLKKYGEVASWRFRLWHRFADKYIWGKSGESYRRLFDSKIIAIKYISYYLLKTPIVWRIFVFLLSKMKLIIHPVWWRTAQVSFDCTSRGVKVALEDA